MKKVILIMVSCLFMNIAHAEFDLNAILGNQEIGANCSSDYECESLCCNQSTGSCAPHDPYSNTPAYCNKTAGQRCISYEFCKAEYVVTCKLVKLSTIKPDGTYACAMRCPSVLTNSSCIKSYCVPPNIPPVPQWDGVDCSNAVDP